MKIAVLAAAIALGVPVLAVLALWFSRVRGYLLSLMIFLTVLGAHGSVNLVSRELYRGPDRGFEFTAADLVCWALILAVGCRAPGRIAWFPRNSWLLLLFFLYAALLAVVSPEPLYTAFTLWKCVRMYALYWCAVNCLRVGVPRRYVWLGLSGAACVITVLAIQQKYLFGIYRINGPFDHSNTVPLYANLMLPVLLLWALCDRDLPLGRAILSIGLCFGLLFAMLSTFSRAGMAFSAVCVAGSLAWANYHSQARRVRIATALVSVALLAGLIRAAGPILERIRTAPQASGEARDEFNYAAQLMLADHPLGIGLNNFSYVLTTETNYREHFAVMRNEEQAGVAHHIYWLTAAETGYPGLLLYLAIVARILWTALAAALRRKTIEGALCFGVFLGICALQASGFYEWAFRVTPVTQMFILSAAFVTAWSGRAVGQVVNLRGGCQPPQLARLTIGPQIDNLPHQRRPA